MGNKHASLILRLYPALHKAAFLFAFMAIAAFQLAAQSPEFKVQITKDVLLPGDTVELYATYKIEGRELPPATFAATLVNADSSMVWQMRWPLVDGEADASFVLPDAMPAGNYYLMMALQPRFLSLFMRVIHPRNLGIIRANFRTADAYATEVRDVDRFGKFSIENLLIKGDCKVEMVNPESSDPALTPMVTMDAWLDSTYEPAAYAVKQLVVKSKDEPLTMAPQPVSKQVFFATGFGCFQSNFPVQQAMKKYAGVGDYFLYDSLYMPAAFKKTPSLLLNTFSDSSWKKYNTVYEWLEARLRNISIGEDAITMVSASKKGRPSTTSVVEQVLQVRANNYRLWSDGTFGSIDPLLRRPEEMAVIKLYEPPFGGFKSGGDNKLGCIAFFDRKYPFVTTEPVRNTFYIKGYTRAYYLLPLQGRQ